jgi:hypothetical protein
MLRIVYFCSGAFSFPFKSNKEKIRANRAQVKYPPGKIAPCRPLWKDVSPGAGVGRLTWNNQVLWTEVPLFPLWIENPCISDAFLDLCANESIPADLLFLNCF